MRLETDNCGEWPQRTRKLVRDPRGANGKGNMSALETQEMTGMGLSLEPPLSPPVVRSSASPEAQPDAATPLPALRPPEPAPEPEPLMAPQPVESAPAAPQPEPLPAVAPAEPELPAIAPESDPEPTPVIPVNFPPAPAPEPTPAEPPAADTEIPAELPAIEPFPPAPLLAPEPALPAPAEHPLLDQIAHSRGGYRVVVRLNDGGGIDVGEFKDFGTAMEGAQEVIEQFTTANGSWPFYAGRFIRPDLIVSVDVVDA
jgi:hypothetical protein